MNTNELLRMVGLATIVYHTGRLVYKYHDEIQNWFVGSKSQSGETK